MPFGLKKSIFGVFGVFGVFGTFVKCIHLEFFSLFCVLKPPSLPSQDEKKMWS